MTRVIRPIGKVSAALKRHGYRQQAVVLIDGEPVPHVAILSKQVGGKVKFEGHWIDPNGELHKTQAFADMKLAAERILMKRDSVLRTEFAVKPAAKKAAKPAAKPTVKERRAARRQHSSKPSAQSAGAMIECKGCGKRHPDDTLCPED